MLKLSSKFSLPLDVAGEATAILAKRGAGKSNTAKVIVERTIEAGIQVVVLDPVGHWWGLRSLFPVPVVGGMHGDVPLEPGAGKLLAGVAVESSQSMVLDVSGLDTNGAMQRFTYEFAEEFYKLKQAHPSPVLIALEEADEFAPQNTSGPNVPRMVGAFSRMMKRGRGRGIGMLVVSQRSAALNKNVLDQADTLIVMRTVGPRDRKAIQGWVEHQQAEGAQDVIPSLPSLQTGEAWVWAPERGVLQRIKVDKARSLDTSSGKALTQMKPLKPVDLDALGEQIKALAEKQAADDPVLLRKRLHALERAASDAEDLSDTLAAVREAAVAGGENAAEALVNFYVGVSVALELGYSATVVDEVRALADRPPESVEVEVPVLGADQLLELTTAVNMVSRAVAPVAEALGKIVEQPRELPTRTLRPPPPPPPVRTPVAAPAPSPRPEPTSNGKLSRRSERAVLTALFQYPEGRTRTQTALLSGYSGKGGTFGSALSKLRSLGWVEGSDHLRLTPEGHAAAAEFSEPLPRGRELLDYWLSQMKRASERETLLAIVAAWPGSIARDEAGVVAGYEPAGGTFGSALSKLRSLELITGSAELRAADELFD